MPQIVASVAHGPQNKLHIHVFLIPVLNCLHRCCKANTLCSLGHLFQTYGDPKNLFALMSYSNQDTHTGNSSCDDYYFIDI